MAPTIPSTSLVPVQPAFTAAERLALAGYLAGCRGLTREAYTLSSDFTVGRLEGGPSTLPQHHS
jgi:hypothetical protein